MECCSRHPVGVVSRTAPGTVLEDERTLWHLGLIRYEADEA